MPRKWDRCECDRAGFCQRFERDMPAEFHRLCREHDGYREVFNEMWAGKKAKPRTPRTSGAAPALSRPPISPRTGRKTLAKLLAGPPRSLPGEWATWNNVQDFHAQAATEYIGTIEAFDSERFAGRGVVICGGGRYLASAYVTVRALRHVGCRLPIELWYFGSRAEFDSRAAAIFEPLGVTPIDADEVQKRHPFRCLNSFEIKPFATFHSRFEEVLFLDADCYPCRNPELLFNCPQYLQYGATFWPDLAHTATWLNWAAFRVASDGRPPIESGQYLINKRRCWTALNLTLWYNDHSDFTYRHTYGDKELWHVAFARLAQTFVMYQDRPLWAHPAFVHLGPDGQPIFIHRVQGKFVLGAHAFYSIQRQVRNDLLPLEAECFQWLSELATAWAQPN